MMQLYIANKNYSTWSMRPWLVLHAFNLPFQEILIPFLKKQMAEQFKQQMLALHANGKVPLLQHDAVMIWDSLAICEYLAEQFQDLPLWPKIPHNAHGHGVFARKCTVVLCNCVAYAV